MKKRLLTITSVFLVFCMLFTAFPVAAATIDGNSNENNASVDNNMKITSNNSVGAMIADAVGEEQDK